MLRVVIVMLLVAIQSFAHADWYLAAGVGMDLDVIDQSTYANAGLVNESVGSAGALKETRIEDQNPHARFSFGHRGGVWDVESFVRYKYRNDWNLRPHSERSANIIFNDIGATTVGVSAIRRFGRDYGWRWLAGVGVGATRFTNSSTYIERANPDIGLAESKVRVTTNQTNFTWEATFGAERQISPRWSLRIAYHYANFGEVEAGPYPDKPVRFVGEHETHSIEFVFMRDLRRY